MFQTPFINHILKILALSRGITYFDNQDWEMDGRVSSNSLWDSMLYPLDLYILTKGTATGWNVSNNFHWPHLINFGPIAWFSVLWQAEKNCIVPSLSAAQWCNCLGLQFHIEVSQQSNKEDGWCVWFSTVQCRVLSYHLCAFHCLPRVKGMMVLSWEYSVILLLPVSCCCNAVCSVCHDFLLPLVSNDNRATRTKQYTTQSHLYGCWYL